MGVAGIGAKRFLMMPIRNLYWTEWIAAFIVCELSLLAGCWGHRRNAGERLRR
jgi:hypothetical protein